MNEVLKRVVGAGVGFAVAKLAALGVTLTPEAQATVTIAVYGVVHSVLGRWLDKK